jgi:hypothetical protein
MADLRDTDIYSLAHDFLRAHRDMACPEALRQADRRLRQDDLPGYLVWRRLAKAIEHIRRMERKTDMAA